MTVSYFLVDIVALLYVELGDVHDAVASVT